MAYNGANLSEISQTMPGSTHVFVYTTTDSLPTVEAAGYFSDAFDRGLRQNDLVLVVNTGTNSVDMCVVTTAATVNSKAATVSAASSDKQQQVVTSIATVGAGTLTAAALVGGIINRSGSTAAYSDTTDTAANIIAALNSEDVGTAWEVTILNTTAFAETITGGTGVTVSGDGVIPQNSVGRFLMTVGAGSTITMQGLYVEPLVTLPQTQYVSISAGNGTLAAGNMEGAQDCTLASSGATAMTTRTAAQIIAAIPNWQIGNSYRLRVYNTNAGTLTLTGGTGVTITGTATIATNVWRDYYVTYTAAGAVGMQNLGAGDAT